MTDNIKINKIQIGKGLKPMIVAEMSGNHNQSLTRALQITEAAAAVGVQALKIQPSLRGMRILPECIPSL